MADTLKSRLDEAVKQAMRSREKARVKTLRLAMAEIKQREVDGRGELDDAQVTAVLDKMQKQRRESIAQYREGGRDDLADVEAAEMAVLQEFLPEPVGQDEQDRLIDEAIERTGAASMRDMGPVMGRLKAELQGRADLSAVSKRVREKLGN